MGWEDDEEYPELSKDPEAVARRAEAARERQTAGNRIMLWAYAVLAVLIAAVVVLWLTTR